MDAYMTSLAAGIGVFLSIAPYTESNAAQPSFNCSRATQSVEKLICKDEDLSELDRSMAASYREWMKHASEEQKAEIQGEQRAWIRTRNNCARRKDVKECVLDAYGQRFADLNWTVARPDRKDGSATAGKPPAPLTRESIENATLTVPGSTGSRTIKLVDGRFSVDDPDDPGFGSLAVVESALGDMDFDGIDDAAVIMEENAGGSAIEMSLYVIVATPRGPVAVDSVYLGDRANVASLKIANHRILVSATVPGPDDPACCPSFKAEFVYELRNGRLAER